MAQRQGGMEVVAREMKDAHLRPMEGANAPRPDPFPSKLRRGLLLGVVLGAILGLIVGELLYGFAVVIPGWELLYSMGPFSFRVFWVLHGIAAGALLLGVIALFRATPNEGL